jgi:hypothetical protein
MFKILAKFIDETQKVAEATHRGIVRSLQKAAYAIYRSAKESIEQSDEPGEPGEPPHTKQGQLPRSLRYDVDKDAEIAVIGPRATIIGTSAMAHEFGGEYKGEEYPERPFMGPALQRNQNLIPGFFSGEVTNQ